MRGGYGKGRTITAADLPPDATEVPAGMFRRHGDISAVVLPGVTVVRENAFFNCISLKKVEMPDLKTVEENGFGNCDSITSGTTITAADLPEGATEVPARMFVNRGDITAVVLPGVTVVGEEAFYNCINLARVDMPALKTVEEMGFCNCPKITSGTKITSAHLPGGATEVPAEMFADRGDITAVVLPGVTVVREEAFSGCINLVSVTMPNLETVENMGLGNCLRLNSVVLPNLITLESNAFVDCPSLTEVSLPLTAEIHPDAFAGDDAPTNLVIHFLGDPLLQKSIDMPNKFKVLNKYKRTAKVAQGADSVLLTWPASTVELTAGNHRQPATYEGTQPR